MGSHAGFGARANRAGRLDFTDSDHVLLAELALHGEIKVLDEQLLFLSEQGGGLSLQGGTQLEAAADAKRPRTSTPGRVAVEYLRAIQRVGLGPGDRRSARAMVLTQMAAEGTVHTGGRTKRWIQTRVRVGDRDAPTRV